MPFVAPKNCCLLALALAIALPTPALAAGGADTEAAATQDRQDRRGGDGEARSQRGFGRAPSGGGEVQRRGQDRGGQDRWGDRGDTRDGRAGERGDNRSPDSLRAPSRDYGANLRREREGGLRAVPNRYRDDRRDQWRDDRHWDHHDWRADRRYDWRSYRDRNRSIFSIGSYYSPYRDYRYRRLNIGYRLDSPFYGSRYYISDPWRYRLPQVYGPYRWVRYYDDVLLVDIHRGEVVDVIYDFFW